MINIVESNNFIISEKEEVTLIDFPQMVSTNHENARMYFERDAKGLWNFFNKKLDIFL